MGCDVLIIEDDPSIAEIVKINLQCIGLSAIVAGNGAMGLDADRHENPSVILMDIRLPDMDGWDICRKIRERTGDAVHPAIIFLTAATQHQDREKAKAAGGNGFIEKPFDIDDLLSAVKNSLQLR